MFYFPRCLKIFSSLNLQNALDQLKQTMTIEKEEALNSMKSSMEADCKKKLSQLTADHEKEINAKLREIDEQKQQSEKLTEEITRQEEMRKQTENRLEAILTSYQQFINSQPGFSQGQADYLLKDFLSSSDQ